MTHSLLNNSVRLIRDSMMFEESHDGFGIGSEAGVEVLGNGDVRAETVDHLTTDPKVKEPGSHWLSREQLR